MGACVMHDTCMVHAQVYHSMHGACMVLPFMHDTCMVLPPEGTHDTDFGSELKSKQLQHTAAQIFTNFL